MSVRAATLALARDYQAALGAQMAVPQTAEVNPPRWELGHVAWFQQLWIERNPQRGLGWRCDPGARLPPSDPPQADEWYDSSAVPHATRWHLPLPSLSATLAWMERTQARTLERLDALPPDAGDDDLYFYRLACLHEAMHVEAARYMALQLQVPVRLAPATVIDTGTALRVPAQSWTLGWSGPGFAFDNELPPQALALDAFDIDAGPVSWSRFGEFVAAGGFDDRRWWAPQGWDWRQRNRPAQPAFPSGQDPAVHLSAHEADAWCRWAGRRLPSEAEWECAALTDPRFTWGRVWEWTASSFEPFPGFEPHPYRDYSQPWFGQRRVLRGASQATPDCLVHPRFRNFFEPARTDIFSGFRSCA